MHGTIISDKIYTVNELGQISCTHSDGFKTEPSDTWKCLGAMRYNNFGSQVEFAPFEELERLNNQWKHKNGKQKWHIVDYDHGTIRVWGSPNHEGSFYS